MNNLSNYHVPKLYRYKVAQPSLLRARFNRYPGCIIGIAVVVLDHAYCIKWAKAK